MKVINEVQQNVAPSTYDNTRKMIVWKGLQAFSFEPNDPETFD